MWAPPVYGDGPAAIATWYAVIYFVLSCGFTAALQSMMAAVQELMPDAKSISQQTALGQPVNLMAYTITGLIFPSIAFTQAPDDATVDNGCCVQPLQRCQLSDNNVLPCACFVNNEWCWCRRIQPMQKNITHFCFRNANPHLTMIITMSISLARLSTLAIAIWREGFIWL